MSIVSYKKINVILDLDNTCINSLNYDNELRYGYRYSFLSNILYSF